MPTHVPDNDGAISIRVSKAVKSFGDFNAVDGLDLEVRRGEMFGLLGPNGSGKTTTVRMLCGLGRLDAGVMEVLGKIVPDRSVASRIGYMPQETALYEDLTAHQNLTFFGRVYGMTKRELDRREKELLDFIDLAGRRDQVASEMSGGMKHRLSLACALIHDPPLLLLDEPTVGVDPELRASFWEYFRRLKGRGDTILITTHYMDEAKNCDRVGFMGAGKLLACGTPDGVMEQTGTDNLEDAFLAYSRETGR